MASKLTEKWLLFLISALMYPVAFYYAQSFFWLSFLYLVPVFFLGATQKLTGKDGYLWGVLALSAHEVYVFSGLYTMATGPVYERLIPFAIIIAFRAIFPACWFFLTEAYLRCCFFTLHTFAQRLFVWVITAWFYELWMDWAHLWPCGVCEGYIFFNPLIPLGAYPPLLYLVSVLGMPFALLYLFACSGAITYAVLVRHARARLLAAGMLAVWGMGFVVQREQQAPAWLERFGVLQQKFLTCPEASAVMVLQERCAYFKEQYPAVACIICPESCIYEPDLPLQFKAYAHQHDNILESLQVVIGGFYDEEEGQRNTAYYVDHNQEIYKFYKRHAMPLTERVPSLFNAPCIRELYFSARPQIAPSTNIRPLWICGEHAVSPYICSELFFNATPDDYYPNTTILAVCNDTWAPPLAQYVMYLGALFRAIEWQRDVIYVSYYYAACITKTGQVYALQALTPDD